MILNQKVIIIYRIIKRQKMIQDNKILKIKINRIQIIKQKSIKKNNKNKITLVNRKYKIQKMMNNNNNKLLFNQIKINKMIIKNKS